QSVAYFRRASYGKKQPFLSYRVRRTRFSSFPKEPTRMCNHRLLQSIPSARCSARTFRQSHHTQDPFVRTSVNTRHEPHARPDHRKRESLARLSVRALNRPVDISEADKSVEVRNGCRFRIDWAEAVVRRRPEHMEWGCIRVTSGYG